MDRRERIKQLAFIRIRVTDPIGRKQRKFHRSRQVDHGVIASFLISMKVTLQFGVDAFCTENPDELFESRANRRAFTGEAHQAFRILAQFFLRCRGFTLGRAQLHGSDQAAQVLIPGAILDQQRIMIAIGSGDLGADVRLRSYLLRRPCRSGARRRDCRGPSEPSRHDRGPLSAAPDPRAGKRLPES